MVVVGLCTSFLTFVPVSAIFFSKFNSFTQDFTPYELLKNIALKFSVFSLLHHHFPEDGLFLLAYKHVISLSLKTQTVKQDPLLTSLHFQLLLLFPFRL